MNRSKQPLLKVLPHPKDIRHRLGDALREAELLRKLLRICERAEEFRQADECVTSREVSRVR